MKVGFIGTGNMGGALAHAAAQSPAPAELLLSNRTPEKAQALAQQLGATVSDNETIARTCDYIFLGVKPQMMADLLARLQPILSRRQEGFVLVSMAAGLALQRLREMAGLSCPILRIMPNTACAVGAGLTLYVPSPEVTEEQLSDFLTLMSASGRLEPLEEHLIDAGSAVAGCGGAFVSLFLEALAEADLRGKSPKERAQTIIENCVHPDYKNILWDYLKLSDGKAQTPQSIRAALGMHAELARSGDMKNVDWAQYK